MTDGMFDAYADLAAQSGWGPCSECLEWMPRDKMVEVDGLLYCAACAEAAAVVASVDLDVLRRNVQLLAEGEGLSMLEAVSLLQTGAAAAGETAVLEALIVLKREFIPGLGGAL